MAWYEIFRGHYAVHPDTQRFVRLIRRTNTWCGRVLRPFPRQANARTHYVRLYSPEYTTTVAVEPFFFNLAHTPKQYLKPIRDRALLGVLETLPQH